MSKPNPIPNSKPFKKGQSGNPKGRPVRPNLNELLDKIMGEEKNGMTGAEAILAALRLKATKGDVRAAEVLLERTYGKSVQKIQADVNSTEGIRIFLQPDQGCKPIGTNPEFDTAGDAGLSGEPEGL